MLRQAIRNSLIPPLVSAHHSAAPQALFSRPQQPRPYQLLASHGALAHPSPSPRLPLSPQPPSPDATLTSSLRALMQSGSLIPDAIIHRLLTARLSLADVRDRGYVLDGYPRTPAQSHSLVSSALAPSVAVELDLPRACATERLAHAGRGRADDDDAAAVEQRMDAYDAARGGVLDALDVANVRIAKVDVRGKEVEEVADEVAGIVEGDRRVLLMGRAGCGKSVQGRILMRGGGPVHLSTGEILRQICGEKEESG